VTVHFPAKEELLFDAEPFTLGSLSKRLAAPMEPSDGRSGRRNTPPDRHNQTGII
jgi:hypothetical protein